MIDRYLSQRIHFFPYLSLFLSIGIYVYFTLDNEPSLGVAISFFTAPFFLYICMRLYIRLCESESPVHLSDVLLAFTCVGVGFLVAYVRTHSLDTHFITDKQPHITIQGTIQRIEQAQNHSQRYVIEQVNVIDEVNSNKRMPLNKIQLRGSDSLNLLPGQQVTCDVTLLPLSGKVSPVAYDFKQAHYFNSISATGRIHSCAITTGSQTTFENFRHSLTRILHTQLHAPYGAIAAALVTGDKSGIPKELRQQFTDAGLAHVLAISGLHLGIIAGLLFFISRRFFYLLATRITWIYPKIFCTITTLCGVCAYLLISGCGYPAIRSFCMTSIVLVGFLANRHPLSMRSVSLAAIVILLLYPESLLSASFQLSFAAVIALIACYEHLWIPFQSIILNDKKTHPLSRKIGLYACGILLTTLIATIATTPLSMAIFNRLTLQSLLGNFFAIPLIGFWIMPILLLSVCLLPFGGSTICFGLLEYGLSLLTKIAVSVSGLPGAIIAVQTPSNWFFAAFAIGGMLLCIGPFIWMRLTGVMIFFSSFLAFYNVQLPVVYFSDDHRTVAYYTNQILHVSDLKKGQFFHDQWRQHLGLLPHQVQQITTQTVILPQGLLLIDPFMIRIKDAYDTPDEKKRFIRSHRKQDMRVMTNAYLDDDDQADVVVNAQELNERGHAFVYRDNRVVFARDNLRNRPWR